MPAEQVNRPNPDELLRAIELDSKSNGRGKLKIFFGACAGVGKTFAMLKAAHDKKEDGINVIVGVVETHGRPETEELIKDLVKLTPIITEHKGIKLSEFNLDEALKLKPKLVLVDELAHTNAPSSRHPKRWMDIEELLEAGIDVYTTLNVQHLESVNDIVTGITGIKVNETVPDAFFDKADEVALIDIPSEDLLERLKEGNVYITDIGKKRAAENFFRKENLIALRELALRRTAERVDLQNDVYSKYSLQKKKIVSDKLLVCIGAGDLSPKLLRTTKRLADNMKCHWVCVYLENERHYRLDDEGLKRLDRNMQLAKELGANTEIIKGENAATTILDYARKNGVTKIVAGKPIKSKFTDIFTTSLVDDLIRESPDIDIYVVTGSEYKNKFKYREKLSSFLSINGFVYSLSLISIITALGLVVRGKYDSANLIMLYMIAVVAVATKYGRSHSILASLIITLSYNFFFTEPYYTFNVYSSGDIVTLLVFCITSIIAGSQTAKLLAQRNFFRKRERNISALYSMSQELTSVRGRENIVEVVRKHLEQALDGVASFWIPDPHQILEMFSPKDLEQSAKEYGAALWAFEHKQPAGRSTSTLPSSSGYYIPINGSNGIIGILGFAPREPEFVFTSDVQQVLDNFSTLAASALDRAANADLAEKSKVEVESEKLRNLLLSAVSHDLRTPLASVKGTISSLKFDDKRLDANKKHELLESAYSEVSRLERFVNNILDLSKIESGRMQLNRDFYFIPELIGNAIKNTKSVMDNRKILFEINPKVPAIFVDGVLIEQVFVNLLENISKHTPENTEVIIETKKLKGSKVKITFQDNGPGIPEDFENTIFDKFTTTKAQGRQGTGLGLAICKAIVINHGGKIRAENLEQGGALFTIILPLGKEAPKIDEE